MSRKITGGKKILPGTASERILANRPRLEPEPPQVPTLSGKAYVAAYLKEEQDLYKNLNKISLTDQKQDNVSHCGLSEVDSMTICTNVTTMTTEETTGIYSRYDFSQRNGEDLPVHQMKDDILSAIDTNRIVIIKGATGCGKTTQVPQFILDAAREKDLHCKIVVTQPRRIAATSVATRVSKERGWTLGKLVGYQIGLDKKGDDDTRILYVTTGILLQKLIRDKEMKEFTHYIIDEIHERDQDMDFLLIVVRNFLNTKSPDARLIIMSATMDTTKFHNYLVTYYGEREFNPLVVEIKEESRYKINKFFLDDLCAGKIRIYEAASLIPFDGSPKIQENAYITAVRIIQGLDQLDSAANKNAVLVFLPGIHEIQEMDEILRKMSTPARYSLYAIKPLHSSITSSEQQSVFEKIQNPKMRKIILSTNIAESSVTVSDIKYVIDFCMTKSLVTDYDTGCTSLELVWASKNNLIQREGRVGRVSDGRVFKMISRDFYENLEQEATPEMIRCPLENVVLRAKLLDMGPPKKVLALALDQPDLKSINQAVSNLKEIGALLVFTENEEYDPCDGEITFMGRVMERLPLDVRLGKLIFLGNIFDVTEESIVMACAMTTKNMFSTPYGMHLEAYDAKLEWADSSCSDCIAFLNAYKAWRRFSTESNDFKKHGRFASDNFLQLKALKEIGELEHDIKQRLSSLQLYNYNKFKPMQRPRREIIEDANAERMRPFYLKLAIAGAFYPNYFVRGCHNPRIDETEAVKMLGGNDPFSSVYLQGLPNNQRTEIYKQCIKESFNKIDGRLEVNLDQSSKAYITFRRSLSENSKAIPGKIEMAVYRAIKMRYTDVKFTIPRLKVEEATKIYDEHVEHSKCVDSELRRKMNLLVWPWKKVWKDDKLNFANELLEVRISHVENPHKFWVQSSLPLITNLINKMLRALNLQYETKLPVSQLPVDADLAIGSIFAARCFEENDTFHRCRIIGKKEIKKKFPIEFTYTIYFIDHGSSKSSLPADEIYDIVEELRKEYCIDELPDLALECSLVKLRPSNDDGLSKMAWDKSACNLLKSFLRIPTVAKIYSIVNGVLRIKLVIPEKKDEAYKFEHTVNNIFIKLNHAIKMDEDCSSLLYHEDMKRYRKNVKDDENMNISAKTKEEVSFDNFKLENIDVRTRIFLKGPFSPLEMKLLSLTRATMGKLVKIERDSVNSVLLDSDPSDPKERMVVAGYVGLSPSKDKLNLKHTTIMPNLPALPMLCCLVFSPMVELRCNPSLTQYCGAICGLGYDRETKLPYFPANDVEILFDHEISDEIIELINRIRFRLNEAVLKRVDKLNEVREVLRTRLKELFCEKSYELQQTHVAPNSHCWGLIEYNRLRDPQPRDVARHPADDEGVVYRLIWAIRRTGDEEKEIAAVLTNLNLLKSYSQGGLSVETFNCKLCGVMLENRPVASLHLKLAVHRARVKRYHKLYNKDDSAASGSTRRKH